MFDWIQRQQLVRKGLACDKTRRHLIEDSWISFLETSRKVRIVQLSFFAVLLTAASYWFSPVYSTEIHLLSFIVFLCGLIMLQVDRPEIWNSNSALFLALGSVWLNVFISKAIFVWLLTTTPKTPLEIFFFLPTAFAPLLLTLLLGLRAGLFGVFFYSLLLGLFLDRSFNFLLISLISGFTAVYFSRRVRRRNDLIKAGVAVGLASLLCAISFGLVSGQNHALLLKQALIGISVGIGTAMMVNAILPVLESVFGLTTDISWIESADLNHPLLQQMTIEAPGTYHHSLVVANLAEAAATAIGANATQTRVMAYFHDIGKMIKPEYFTENSGLENSPHDDLSPNMSALVIIAHVKEGIDLALKYRLKKPILDAIQQHHGDTVVYYFYNRARKLQEDAVAGGKIMKMRQEDIPEVSKNSFRYPGPRPQTKEVGLLMLADAIEGASRSLERPNPQKIESLVAEIIKGKIDDHQLDECGLSLTEIRRAQESFVFTVTTMLHSRISYPKDEKNVSASVPQSPKRSAAPASSSSAAA